MSPSKDGEGFSSNTNGEIYNERGWLVQNARGYRINEDPYDTHRKLRVIHIGAGASGIVFSKFAEDRLNNVDVQIYEKNTDVGGTWLENRYACLTETIDRFHSDQVDRLKISWLR